MPCNGIAVLTAQMTLNLQAHFDKADHRHDFAAWLRQYGVLVKRWWPMRATRSWALGIGSDWTGLQFVGSEIRISDERDYLAHQAEVDRAFELAQLYTGSLSQQQVVETCAALGLNPQNITCGGYGSPVLTFTLQAGVTVLVKVHLDGRIEMISQDGDFDTGKTVLEALLAALQVEGVNIQPTGQVETHHHDVLTVNSYEHYHQH